MAGLGYKDFTAGAVLTAAQVDGYLMEQSVMNFAGTAARGSALSGVVAAGMVAHVGAGTLTVYDGSAWKQVYPTSGGGKVLQVVNATYNTVVNTTSSTYTATNLTVNITPSSATNKILVIVFQAGIGKDTSSGSSVLLKLFRDATELALFEGAAAYTQSTATNYVGSAGITYLDSPATTSAVTYSTKFASGDNSGNAGVQKSSARSTITVMEISA